MVFDGAAYYGLPSATQASTSGSQKPAPAATTHPYRGNAQNTNNIIYNNKQSSRGIIQRPYSYESSQNTYYAGTQPSQGFQQPWHGQAPLYGQMWQHQSIQPYDLNMHSRGGQSVQHAPAPPLPPGPPPPAPPPLLRHALPPKPQAAFFPPNNARAASLPRPDAHELPAVLKPMRQVPEQRPQDYRAQRVGQPDSHFTSNNAHPNVSAKLFCEICKLRFNSTIHLIAHQRNEHVKCCKYDDGCMFEGMPDVVEIHEQDRHLIFRPGARREKTRPDGPPGAKIQGTNISLETEEDIAKWIEERKRKWPGNKNKELRLQRELKRKAYEAASPAITNNPTKTGKKARISKAGTAAQHPEGYQRAPRIWGQATSDASNILEASDRATVDSSDDEGAAADVAALLTQSKGQVHSENSSPPPRVVSQDPHPGSNGKASERQASAEPLQVAEMDGDDSDHDSAPEEVDYSNGRPTVDEESEAAMDLPDQTSDSSKAHRRHDQMRPSCNAWTTQGTCKFGKQCRYEHDPSKRGKVRHEPRQAAKNPFERGDLIGKLVHHQIRHEVSDLTQVIDFLARNDWLRHVELYPGHKAELDGRINEVSS